MALLRSIATVGGMTMISRILGFVRDVLVAAALGAGPVADAFFVAFKFPNLFRRLFAEGAFSLAFVPIQAGIVETEGRDAARAFAEQAFAVLLWALLVLVLAVEVAMPWILMAFVPGFLGEPGKFDLTVELTRITFPYILFISLVSLLGGVLNSLHRFAAAAFAPALLNLCLIGAVLGLGKILPTAGHALAWGVAAAGVVQFAWLYGAAWRAGIRVRWVRPRLTPQVRILLKRMVPVAVGAGIYQINLVADTVLASLLPSGSISYLFYADRVTQLPLGVVGVAVGTALLPLMARQLRAGKVAEALYNQNRAIEVAFLFTLPAAVALAVAADPIVRVLFQRGHFGPEQAGATAGALAAFALGLPAYVLVKALSPGFYAREDTRTPVKVAALCMGLNIAFNLVLMWPFKHVGIAIGTVLSAWINAGILAYLLGRRGHLEPDARLKSRLPRGLAASLAMGAVLWGTMMALDPWLAGGEATRAAALAV
ncbi:MAG: murein biosynthesis integral membrane protein MurJ, partial [Magnetospirillum sp. WYHS-4]